jgi:hypothetical protein
VDLPESDEYYRILGYPDHLSSTAVLARMLDGLGFRFYWATEGLRHEDYTFRPAGDIMSIEELTMHVWQLINWISTDALKTRHYRNPKDGPDAREQTLVIIHDLKAAILAMNNEQLSELHLLGKPFWHIINGPFSDALTHTGQINSFRRLNGNPCAGANVFKGEPPKAEKTG